MPYYDHTDFLPVAVTGAQFKLCRELAGLSVAQMADQLGLTKGARAVRELEDGERPISGPMARCALVMAGVWPFECPEPDLFIPMTAPLPFITETELNGLLAQAAEL